MLNIRKTKRVLIMYLCLMHITAFVVRRTQQELQMETHQTEVEFLAVQQHDRCLGRTNTPIRGSTGLISTYLVYPWAQTQELMLALGLGQLFPTTLGIGKWMGFYGPTSLALINYCWGKYNCQVSGHKNGTEYYHRGYWGQRVRKNQGKHQGKMAWWQAWMTQDWFLAKKLLSVLKEVNCCNLYC